MLKLKFYFSSNVILKKPYLNFVLCRSTGGSAAVEHYGYVKDVGVQMLSASNPALSLSGSQISTMANNNGGVNILCSFSRSNTMPTNGMLDAGLQYIETNANSMLYILTAFGSGN